jgi:hypothetical protein
MTSYSPNSVLWIHPEFEGGVRVDLCILYFAHMLGAFLHIHLYMYYIYVAFGPLVIQADYYPDSIIIKYKMF